MDIVAHTLWACAGVALVRRHRPVSRRVAALTILLAALPDILHLVPIAAWWAFGSGTLETIRAYAVAVPGDEPSLPPLVGLASHHLHCIMHSAPVALAVTMLIWALRGSPGLALAGWWSHIVIDVFTHSADYYAVSVLYPFTYRGFDGLAWNTPWFLLLNYASLGVAALWLWLWRTRRPAPQ